MPGCPFGYTYTEAGGGIVGLQADASVNDMGSLAPNAPKRGASANNTLLGWEASAVRHRPPCPITLPYSPYRLSCDGVELGDVAALSTLRRCRGRTGHSLYGTAGEEELFFVRVDEQLEVQQRLVCGFRFISADLCIVI